MHAPGERCRAGWASAPGPVHMPRMNALARLRPGSSDCLPAGVARQRKGTKRIITPAAQGPRPSAVHLPRHAAIPFAPCTGADAETPLTTSQLFTGALDQRGGNRKTADSGGKAVRIVFFQMRFRSGGKVQQRSAAFLGHGLHDLPGVSVMAGIIADNGFHCFSSSVQPKSL